MPKSRPACRENGADSRSRRAALPWQLLGIGLLLAACASLIGIDERKLDSADSYPPEGYIGCQAGVDCGACLAVHRSECETRALCGDPSALDACTSCVCQDCLQPLIECRRDAGCAAVSECLRQTRCELSEAGAESCRVACAAVIAEHGGLSGAAFRGATAIRTCAVAESCLSCLPAQPEPAPGCRPANGCSDCTDCFQQCLCSGDTFSACREQCSEGAPPAACGVGDGCANCGDCFQVCTCQGGQFAECNQACRVEVPTCTAESSCSDCDGCVSQCVCGGSSPADCEAACQPAAPDDVCRETSRGSGAGTCGGCSSCLAGCTCGGEALDKCMDRCDMLACCKDESCSSLTTCICGGDNADKCLNNSTACDNLARSCDACACDRCPGSFALCQETPGCVPIFECMRSTACQGSACLDRCAGANSQTQAAEAPEAFAVAEALWACHQGTDCNCAENEPASVMCGTSVCNGYVGSNAVLPPCCPGPASDGADTSGAADTCGLNLQAYLERAGPCTPRDQPSTPRALLETCSDLVVSGPPYDGVELKGCCRQGVNLCGYWDDITGLGCLDADIFGAAQRRCL
jgi:hypothetical protein